jgi:hypothetical protein
MATSGVAKRAFVRDLLADFAHRFRVLPLGQHAQLIAARNGLAVRQCSEHSTIEWAAPELTMEASRQ